MTSPPTSRRRWLAAFVGTSLLLVVVGSVVAPRLAGREISPDFSNGYHPGALSIQRGAGFLDARGEAITLWPPGWSILISPVVTEDLETSHRRVHVLGLALIPIWLGLLWLLTVQLLGRSAPVGLLPLAAAWPPMVALLVPAGSDLPFALLLTGATCAGLALARERAWSGSHWLLLAPGIGLTLGLATLVRTIGVALLASFAIALPTVYRAAPLPRRLFAAALVLLAFALPVAPWAVRQARVGSDGGLTQVRDGFLERNLELEAGRRLSALSYDWTSFGDVGEGLARVGRDDPLGVGAVLVGKAAAAWYGTYSRRFDGLVAVFQLPWLGLFVLVSLRALRRFRELPSGVLLLHGLVGATWLLGASVLSTFRYLAPAFPFVVLLVYWHLQDWRARSGRPIERRPA